MTYPVKSPLSQMLELLLEARLSERFAKSHTMAEAKRKLLREKLWQEQEQRARQGGMDHAK